MGKAENLKAELLYSEFWIWAFGFDGRKEPIRIYNASKTFGIK